MMRHRHSTVDHSPIKTIHGDVRNGGVDNLSDTYQLGYTLPNEFTTQIINFLRKS